METSTSQRARDSSFKYSWNSSGEKRLESRARGLGGELGYRLSFSEISPKTILEATVPSPEAPPLRGQDSSPNLFPGCFFPSSYLPLVLIHTC